MTIIPLVTSLRPKVHRAGRYRKSVSFTVCLPFAKRQSLSRYLLAYIISHLFVKNNIFCKFTPWTIESSNVQNPPFLSYRSKQRRICWSYKKKRPQNHRNERLKGENEAFSVYKAKFHSRNPIDYGIFFGCGEGTCKTSHLRALLGVIILFTARAQIVVIRGRMTRRFGVIS